MNNDQEQTKSPNPSEIIAADNRREALKKLGKYSAYAAPFTVLAFSKKAGAATSHGPRKHP